MTFVVGPVSEEATEIRVGVPFTVEWLPPSEAHWVYSPPVNIVKKGEDYVVEAKPGARQEEIVYPVEYGVSWSEDTDEP